jgi:hypothetical protein
MRTILDKILPLDIAASMPLLLGVLSLGLALYAIR